MTLEAVLVVDEWNMERFMNLMGYEITTKSDICTVMFYCIVLSSLAKMNA